MALPRLPIERLPASPPDHRDGQTDPLTHGWQRFRQPLAWALVAVLAVLAVTNVVRGIRFAWVVGDFDLQSRAAEYASFRDGVFPNAALEPGVAGRRIPYSVYPPYALPLFAVFFEPGGLLQGRLLVEMLSIAGLIVIGLHGRRALWFAGPALAAVGAFAGAAITGTIGAFAASQFSILCTVLVTLQLMLLERRRPLAAGACWALAMLKPQIGAAFAILFLVNRQWRGLVLGIAMLAALSLGACWWTDVSPLRLVRHVLFESSLRFVEAPHTFGPGKLAAALGFSGRLFQFAALALMAGLAVAVGLFVRRWRHPIDLMALAGAAGAIGELLCYHQFYDHIMLAPTLVALFALAATRPAPTTIGLAAAVAASVWLPQRILHAVPGEEIARALLWATAAAVLLAWSFTRHLPGRAALRERDEQTVERVIRH
jgi:hypothetical protein